MIGDEVLLSFVTNTETGDRGSFRGTLSHKANLGTYMVYSDGQNIETFIEEDVQKIEPTKNLIVLD